MASCYICHAEFEKHDVVIPIQIDVTLPFGHVHVVVIQHYMCGLEMFLSIEGLKGLTDTDRTKVEGRLMEVLTNINSIRVQ